ncbi:hypothetical protein [Actinocorallia lasiicapitis]
MLLGAVLLGGGSPALASQDWQLDKVLEPKVSKGFSSFDRVLAVDARQAWAFGSSDGADFKDRPTNDLLAYRWNGERWRSTRLPRRMGNLVGPVAASGPRDVWAVGLFRLPEAPYPPREQHHASTLARWNGKAWSVVRRWEGYTIGSMAVTGPKDVWLFGSRVVQGRFRAVALHFNGRSWKESSVPLVLGSVVMGVKGHLWGTGLKATPTFPEGGGRLRAVRFDGKRWREVPFPSCERGHAQITRTAGKPMATCNRTSKEKTSVGSLIIWTGTRWKAETPREARGWMLGQPVTVGKNVWIAGQSDRTSETALFHRDAGGRWTRTAITPDPLDGPETRVLEPGHLAIVPKAEVFLRAGSIADGEANPVGAIAIAHYR